MPRSHSNSPRPMTSSCVASVGLRNNGKARRKFRCRIMVGFHAWTAICARGCGLVRAGCNSRPGRYIALASVIRRGGRVAEGARLESVYTGNRIVGSNPTPSARPFQKPILRLPQTPNGSAYFVFSGAAPLAETAGRDMRGPLAPYEPPACRLSRSSSVNNADMRGHHAPAFGKLHPGLHLPANFARRRGAREQRRGNGDVAAIGRNDGLG